MSSKFHFSKGSVSLYSFNQEESRDTTLFSESENISTFLKLLNESRDIKRFSQNVNSSSYFQPGRSH